MRTATLNLFLISALAVMSLPLEAVIARAQRPSERDACAAASSDACTAHMIRKHAAYYTPAERRDLTKWIKVDNRRHRKAGKRAS